MSAMLIQPIPFLKKTGSLLALTLLAACAQEDHGDFAPICPHVDVVAPAADLYAFKQQSKSSDQLIYHVSIEGVIGNCTAAPKKAVRSKISLRIALERGVTNAPLSLDLPYFVAVMRDDKILDKKTFKTHLALPASQANISTLSELRYIDVPASPDLQDTNYALKIGIQLTPDQLRYNRQHLIAGSFHKTDE